MTAVFALMMIDLDWFKAINGISTVTRAGDRVLIEVRQSAQAAARCRTVAEWAVMSLCCHRIGQQP